jgi:phage-related protein (TIGR01555 family)
MNLIRSAMQAFNDGWMNTIIGLGRKQADNTTANLVASATILDDGTLSALWHSDGIAAKIVKTQVDDAIRPWFEIEKDDKGLINGELKRLNFREVLRDSSYWARLYGGSLIVQGFKDGQSLDQPLTQSNRRVEWLRSYPVTRVWFDQSDIDNNPESENFELPLWYRITPLYGSEIRVHYSRCIVLKGVSSPNDQYTTGSDQNRMRYWGMSILQQPFERLAALGSSFQGLDGFVKKFAVAKYKLAGLRDAVASGNSKVIFDRMEIINASTSTVNGVFLDADGGEDYTRDVASMSGVVEFLDREMMMLCGCPNVPPMTRLFGRSPAGLNATGESDLTNYYDDTDSWRTTYLENAIMKVLKSVNKSLPKPFAESELTIKWGEIRTTSVLEDANARKVQMDIDTGYINAQVYSPAECRDSRFTGKYSYATNVDPDSDYAPTAEELEEQERELANTKATQGKARTVTSPLSGGSNSASGAQQTPKDFPATKK